MLDRAADLAVAARLTHAIDTVTSAPMRDGETTAPKPAYPDHANPASAPISLGKNASCAARSSSSVTT